MSPASNHKHLALFFIALWLAIGGNLQAQENAGQAGEFLRTGLGPKAMGMGRAFTSIADDASALYWNPAGMAHLTTVGGTFMFLHIPTEEGASLNYLAGAVPLSLFLTNVESSSPVVRVLQNLKLGLGVLWHSLGEFQFYDETGAQIPNAGENSIGQTAVYVSASYPLNGAFGFLPTSGVLDWFKGDIELGLTSKLVQQDLFGAAGRATSFDLGFKYAHQSGFLQLGLTVRDLNQPSISYGQGIVGDRIPRSGLLGVSVQPRISHLRGLLLSFDYGIIKPAARDRDLMFGLEYDLSTVNSQLPVKIRLGSNRNHETFTFGINFSPELMVGQDWIPSGDVTFVKQKSSFSALNAEYAISVDRNPFTARYWYRRGMLEYRVGSNNAELADNHRARRHFEYARKAKNPGNQAYRFDAALRLSDIEFFDAINDLRNSTHQNQSEDQKSRRRLRTLTVDYSKGSSRYLLDDSGKSEFDRDAYFSSYSYYVQSLILSGEAEVATQVCADSGKTWARDANVYVGEGGSVNPWRAERLDYLRAFALYEAANLDQASAHLEDHFDFPPVRFLSGHIAFLNKDYSKVLEVFADFDFNESRLPTGIFLPLTHDGLFGDEVLFLRAASMFKSLNGFKLQDTLIEFAKIPRFFPSSDMAGFLTNGEAILSKMIDALERSDTATFADLVNRTIDSYIKAFSKGALREEAYTFNYK